MVNELLDAETTYFMVLRQRNLSKALKNNERYYNALFVLYKDTKNHEEKLELSQELEYLEMQAEFLKNIQLNHSEETA